jgi:hypothetical protein
MQPTIIPKPRFEKYGRFGTFVYTLSPTGTVGFCCGLYRTITPQMGVLNNNKIVKLRRFSAQKSVAYNNLR